MDLSLSVAVPKGFLLKQIIESGCTIEQGSRKVGHEALLSAEPLNGTVSIFGCKG